MTTTIASIAAAALASLATWIVHLIWPRTVASPTPSPVGTVNATNLNIAAKAESAGLGWLVPLLKALETANGPLIQVEARFLHRLVEQQGGFAKLLDDAANQILEARLASGGATYLVRFATDAGITPRELLDELEGKTPATATSSSVISVAAPLIALALCLFGSQAMAAYPLGPNFAAGPGHWNADVHAPQAFYPTELNLIADRAMRDCDLPDPKPSVYVQYFYATWCGDCKKSTAVARDLEDKGYQVVKTDAGSDIGARTAKVYNIKSVPFWIVSIDYQTALRTNDPQAVVKLLSQQPKQTGQRTYPVSMGAVYAPDGSCAPCNYGQPAYYQQQQVGFWQRGPARRWLSNRGGWIRNGNHPILRFLFRRRG